MSDSARPPPMPNPRTEDCGWADANGVLVVVTPGMPKVTAGGKVVATTPPAAAGVPGSESPAPTAFSTNVLVYRDSSTLFRAVCRLASRLLAIALPPHIWFGFPGQSQLQLPWVKLVPVPASSVSAQKQSLCHSVISDSQGLELETYSLKTPAYLWRAHSAVQRSIDIWAESST